MDGLPFDAELADRFAAAEIEQMFVSRAAAIAETLRMDGRPFDPATFVWTSVFDLCAAMKLDEAGSTQMIGRLMEGGVIDRTIERLAAERSAEA